MSTAPPSDEVRARLQALVDQINAMCDEASSWPPVEQRFFGRVLVRRGQLLVLLAMLGEDA